MSLLSVGVIKATTTTKLTKHTLLTNISCSFTHCWQVSSKARHNAKGNTDENKDTDDIKLLAENLHYSELHRSWKRTLKL